MGELDALTSYITGIVKRCVSEVFAEEAPKLMGKETKRYYSIDEVCEKLGIRKSAFHDKANKGQFIIVKDSQSTLVDADDLEAIMFISEGLGNRFGGICLWESL